MFRRQLALGMLAGSALARHARLGWAQSSEPIIMGVTFDAAKQASYYALLMRDATILRVEEINAAGGVLGRQIKLLLEDDENNPAIAAQKVEKLAAAGAVFIFEVGSSATGLAAQRAAEDLKYQMARPPTWRRH